MKKYIGVVVAASALAAALVIPAGASAANTNAYEGITSSGNNGAFTVTGCSSIANVHNENIRFGKNGFIAIPGDPQTGNSLSEVTHDEAVVTGEYHSSCTDGPDDQGLVNPPAGE